MAECYECGGSGLIEKRHKINNCLFSFRCSCFHGERHHHMPTWKSVMAIEYAPLFDQDEIEKTKELMKDQKIVDLLFARDKKEKQDTSPEDDAAPF